MRDVVKSTTPKQKAILHAEKNAQLERDRKAWIEEAEKKRLAEEAAEKKRQDDEEIERQRLAAEAAEKKRQDDEEIERQRLAAEAAEKKRLADIEAERLRLAALTTSPTPTSAPEEDVHPNPTHSKEVDRTGQPFHPSNRESISSFKDLHKITEEKFDHAATTDYKEQIDEQHRQTDHIQDNTPAEYPSLSSLRQQY